MSKFFIRRPIVAIVIAILTVIIGVVTLFSLPTSQYPDIVPPEILVTATYPGAAALPGAAASPGSGERHLQGCYADLDGLLSALAVLRRAQRPTING